MYIVAIAWIYVVLMMSITEESIIAGLMTFALYGILPLTIILYIMSSPQRKRQRKANEAAARSGHGTAITGESGELPPQAIDPPPDADPRNNGMQG